jgi:uncharacterized protein (DUF58 family)
MTELLNKYSSGNASPVSIDLPSLMALRQQINCGGRKMKQILATQGGGYQSKFRGRGMEFAEVRSYQFGDDIRSIDWWVTARSGKTHTKLFHEERERPTLVALDYRRPMFFATRGQFKAVIASQLATLIAWQILHQGDRLGAFLFSEERHAELRPQLGKRAVLNLLHQMVNDPVWQRASHKPFEPQQRLYQTLIRLRRVVRPGSAVIIISDFAQWDAEVEKQLTLLKRNNDLTLIFCYDPMEAQLPPAGNYPVSNGQQPFHINTANKLVRQQYAEQFAAHQQRIQHFCQLHQAHFDSCVTSASATDCFQRLFSGRI